MGSTSLVEEVVMRELTFNEVSFVSGGEMTASGFVGAVVSGAATGAVVGGLAGSAVGAAGAIPGAVSGALQGAMIGALSYSIVEAVKDIME